MRNYYVISKNNETLDYICWRHYVCNNLLEPTTDLFNDPILNTFINKYDPQHSGINGIIEQVLEVNPTLSDYLHLPYGLQIFLPDIKEVPVDLSLKDLWS